MICFKRLDWDIWCQVFQSKSTFEPMIKTIFKNHDLDFTKIENLTPGTNAVFKVGEYVIKLYVPIEIVNWHSNGFKEELEHLIHASSVGFMTPKLVAHGTHKDLYDFNFIVYRYIDGDDADKVIHNYSDSEKIDFVREVKMMLNKYNVNYSGHVDNSYLKDRLLPMTRWQFLNDHCKEQYLQLLKSIELDNYYVHGDITNDNTLVNNKEVYVIDFADACIGPKYYEYPPLIISLFNLDKVMINEFIKGLDKDIFIDDFFKSLILHDFGGDYIQEIYNTLNLDIKSISNLEDIKEIIKYICA